MARPGKHGSCTKLLASLIELCYHFFCKFKRVWICSLVFHHFFHRFFRIHSMLQARPQYPRPGLMVHDRDLSRSLHCPTKAGENHAKSVVSTASFPAMSCYFNRSGLGWLLGCCLQNRKNADGANMKESCAQNLISYVISSGAKTPCSMTEFLKHTKSPERSRVKLGFVSLLHRNTLRLSELDLQFPQAACRGGELPATDTSQEMCQPGYCPMAKYGGSLIEKLSCCILSKMATNRGNFCNLPKLYLFFESTNRPTLRNLLRGGEGCAQCAQSENGVRYLTADSSVLACPWATRVSSLQIKVGNEKFLHFFTPRRVDE